uniref:Uncharacterized protein n=1 Tax=Amphimedon queenslandica TaxID=400682 RepID=A0A1X7UQK1_AMPQE
ATVSPYAITIHKCQGLSLDTAIIDLSTDVSGDVSNPCINKINHLRSKFWNDYLKSRKVNERRERFK